MTNIHMENPGKQSKHIIPVVKSSPVLITNGAEQALVYHLSDDFIVKAHQNGEVTERDDKIGLVIISYKDGTVQAIDTKPRIVKNGAGGFFLSNHLDCDLQKGDKFKKNDILAQDKHFFTNSKLNGPSFNIGSFQKVACMSTYSTFEDGTFITNKLSEDMSSEIVYEKQVVIGKNANVDQMVKVGDEVIVGDPLITFEQSFEEGTLNKFLSSVGKELQEEIKNLGKTSVKAKVSGTIVDIKLYCTVELEELSPSLKKLVSAYYTDIKKAKNLVSKYDKSEGVYKAGILFNEPTEKVDASRDGKVKGTEVNEGLLINFYLRYKDSMGVGDKISFFSALKSIVSEALPIGYEPYTEFRPDEEISSFFAPGAVLARMVPSVLPTMFGNKVLVELKRSLKEIYEEK